MSRLNDIRILILAAWLGAAIFFGAVVAPTAFSVLRGFQLVNTTEIAGSFVNRTLAVVNLSGFIISLIVGLTTLLVPRRPRWLIFELLALGAMALATAVAQWIIAAKMHTLRVSLGMPIDQLPASDARRVAFDALHGYSVTALGIAIIAGLIAFFLILQRARFN